jgi:hypothetical protein
MYKIPFVTELKRIKIMSMKRKQFGRRGRGMPLCEHTSGALLLLFTFVEHSGSNETEKYTIPCRQNSRR